MTKTLTTVYPEDELVRAVFAAQISKIYDEFKVQEIKDNFIEAMKLNERRIEKYLRNKK